MAKALKTAAIVVGVVGLALALPGVGAAIGGAIGLSAGATAAIAVGASALAGALSIASAALSKPPAGSVGGSATAFKINKESGIPIVFGRTMKCGEISRRDR